MVYYPVFLQLKGRPCLVVGGGRVAFRKASALVACGAKVTVVSPRLGAGLKDPFLRKKILWRRHPFRSADLRGAQMVIAATDDTLVQVLVSREAKRRGIWINVVDQPELCSFILPSVVRRGRLVFAISTGGASPALAQWIRKDLQSRYGPEFGTLLGRMAKVRSRVKRKVRTATRRKQLLERALRAYFRVLEEAGV